MVETSDLAGRFERIYVPAVLDVLEERGLRNQVLAPGLTPTIPTARIAGPAYTYSFVRSEEWDKKVVLPPILACYESAPAGSILFAGADQNASFAAIFGELSAATCLNLGLRGAVVDGGLRDGPYVAATGFPVWYRYRTPADVVGRYEISGVGEPVKVGDVSVSTGDYVLADLDGVVVVPAAIVEEVLLEAEQCVADEATIRQRLENREKATELFDEVGRF